MAVNNHLYMSDLEKYSVDGDVVTPSPDQRLAEFGDFVSQAAADVRATPGYQAACSRSEFPLLSLYMEREGLNPPPEPAEESDDPKVDKQPNSL